MIRIAEDGQSSTNNFQLGDDISRKLDLHSKEDNWMMCLASNEGIVRKSSDS